MILILVNRAFHSFLNADDILHNVLLNYNNLTYILNVYLLEHILFWRN